MLKKLDVHQEITVFIVSVEWNCHADHFIMPSKVMEICKKKRRNNTFKIKFNVKANK